MSECGHVTETASPSGMLEAEEASEVFPFSLKEKELKYAISYEEK